MTMPWESIFSSLGQDLEKFINSYPDVKRLRAERDRFKREAEHYPRVAGLNVRLSNILQRWLEAHGYVASPYLKRETREALGDMDLGDTVASVTRVDPRDLVRKSSPPQCPKCDRRMELKTNSWTSQKFWGCDWPKCWGSRDYPRYWEDRGRPIARDANVVGVCVGGPADGQRFPAPLNVDTLNVPVIDRERQGGLTEARYRRQFWPNGEWCWAYEDLKHDDVIELLLANYPRT